MKIYIGNTNEYISKEYHLDETTTINCNISLLEKSITKHEISGNNLYELIKNDLRKDHDFVLRTRFSDYEIGPKEQEASIVFDLFSINHNEFICIDFGDNCKSFIKSAISNNQYDTSKGMDESIFIDTAKNVIVTPISMLKSHVLFFLLMQNPDERMLTLLWYQIESDGPNIIKLKMDLNNSEVDAYCFMLIL
jgi:hypothetical protein